MSRSERNAWAAQLAADPALRAAWEGFRAQLTTAAGRIIEGDEPDLEDIRRAMGEVFAEAGVDRLHH